MGVLYDVYRELQNAMTPAEFEERVLTIRETAKTKSERIEEMQNLIIDLLTELGYEDGADIFAETVNEMR